MNIRRLALLASLALGPIACAEPEPAQRTSESPALTHHTQLTFPDRFAKAGEAYFSPDSQWIIFQAIENTKDGSLPPNAYSMYVARLKRDESQRITGVEDPIIVSPPGSANTCGWFHPTEKGRIIFGSTLVQPEGKAPAGYQRGTSTYAWQFPAEMEVVTMIVPPIFYDGQPKLTDDVDFTPEQTTAQALWTRPGYDAECAYSPDGRWIVHTQVNPETLDPDLFAFDSQTKKHTPLVAAQGYDGGPFFSPDGKAICYRSDRKGNDMLQVFVAELAFDPSGNISGIRNERAATDNEHVNWAPYWHRSGKFLIYTTSEQGHHNYEVYAVEAPLGANAAKSPAELKKRRITFGAGFDGLPVFNADATLMMWTSQRGPKLPSDPAPARPSSQLWIAACADLAP